MITKQGLVCDIKDCQNITAILHVADIGWQFIENKYNICPSCVDKILYDKNYKPVFKN